MMLLYELVVVLSLFLGQIAAICSKFQTVVSGDICWDLAITNGLTLDEFYTCNPNVKCKVLNSFLAMKSHQSSP